MAAAQPTSVPVANPLRLGLAQEFAEVRRYLHASGVTEERLVERLKLESLSQLLSSMHSGVPVTAGDALEIAARLFVVGQSVERAALAAVAPPAVREAFSHLGLLVDDPDRPGFLYCPVALYPTYGFYIVSDRWSRTDGSIPNGPIDCVYPAITKQTQFFLSTLPDEPCDSLLELCSGTGLAAFVGAARARHAWAVDITERSTVFAEFNRRLNGLENVSVLRGDLFEAVSGLTFDCIVSHPPYMPVLRPGYVFYDGGDDGELLSRRTIEQLPRFLRPGGRYYSVALGADKDQEPFEQRIRGWLGSAADEFDVALILKRAIEPETFAAESTVRSGGGPGELVRWLGFFRDRRIRSLAHGEIVIQRHAEPRPPFTVRRQYGPWSGVKEVAWLLGWEAGTAKDAAAQILSSQPKVSARSELSVAHRFQPEGPAPVRFALSTDYPFETDCSIEPWAAMLLSACDGTRTGRELFDLAKRNSLLDAGADLGEFVDYLRVLISGGFLRIEAFPLPRR